MHLWFKKCTSNENLLYEYTFKTKDGDKIIDQIELKNDGAETSKGIYIGSSEADVKAAYGDADGNVGSALVYKEKGKQLEIGITDGVVSTIVLKCVD